MTDQIPNLYEINQLKDFNVLSTGPHKGIMYVAYLFKTFFLPLHNLKAIIQALPQFPEWEME